MKTRMIRGERPRLHRTPAQTAASSTMPYASSRFP